MLKLIIFNTLTSNPNYQTKFKEFIIILILNLTQITNQDSRAKKILTGGKVSLNI